MARSTVIIIMGILCWVLIKWLGLGTWSIEDSYKIGFLVNLAFMTIVAAVAAFESLNQPGVEVGFLNRFKITSRIVISFAVTLVLTMGIWYFYLVPENVEKLKADRIEWIQDAIPSEFSDPEKLKSYLEDHPELKGMETQAIIDFCIDEATDGTNSILSPQMFFAFAGFGWTSIALILSAIFSVIMPKIWGNTP
ncbi:MAG: hypothetical protein O2818_03215 [Bacteroidetes bacterium]|nr:hypothetical protein [Bacteroidota bacterium]MDA1335877.1 hypothetical protein [Bacteroidota bacterium]